MQEQEYDEIDFVSFPKMATKAKIRRQNSKGTEPWVVLEKVTKHMTSD